MALITTVTGWEINPGTTTDDLILNTTELAAAVAPLNAYFGDTDNWKYAAAVFKSENQQKVVMFTGPNAGEFIASPFIREEDFVLKSIMLYDFDSGFFTYDIPEAQQSSYTMEIIPATLPINLDNFISDWELTDGDTVAFSLSSGNKFLVDWGDGTTTHEDYSIATTAQHTYALGSPTTMRITLYKEVGTDKYTWLNITSGKDKLKSVYSLGDLGWTMFANSFQDCTLLHDIQHGNTATVNNMQRMFKGCTSLVTVNTSTWDTSSVVYMSEMFSGASMDRVIGLTSFNTSNCERFEQMFYYSGLNVNETGGTTVTLGWDFSKAKQLVQMFQGSAVTNVDIVSPNFSALKGPDQGYASEGLTSMFEGCTSLYYVNITGMNASGVMSIPYMFKGCTSLGGVRFEATTALPTATTSDIMYYAFDSCTSLDELHFVGLGVANTSGSINASAFYNVVTPGHLYCDTGDVTLFTDALNNASKSWSYN